MRPRSHSVAVVFPVLAVMFFLSVFSGVFPAPEAMAKAKKEKAPPALPEKLSDETINEFLATQDDDQVRLLLIQLLKEEAKKQQAEKKEAAEAKSFGEHVAQIGPQFDRMVNGYDQFFRDLAVIPYKVGGDQGLSGFFWVLVKISILLCFGYLVERLVRRKTAAVYDKILAAEEKPGFRLVGLALARLGLDLVHLVAFVIAALAPGLLAHIQPPRGLFYVDILLTIVLIRAAIILSRVVLSKDHPNLRIARLNDASARFWHDRLVLLAAVWFIGENALDFLSVTQAAESSIILLRSLAGLTVALIMIVVAFQNRKRLLAVSPESSDSAVSANSIFNSRYAPALNTLFALYVLVVWCFWEVTILSGDKSASRSVMMSLMIVPLYLLLDRLGARFLDVVLAKGDHDGLKTPAGEEADADKDSDADAGEDADVEKDSDGDADAGEGLAEEEKTFEPRKYLPIIKIGMHIFLVFFALGYILRAWDIHLPMDGVLVKGFFKIYVAVLLAFLIWAYVKQAVEKRVKAANVQALAAHMEETGGVVETRRLDTLLPMLRKGIGILLAVTMALVVLSALGVNIGPLLASAGIFGLAIGLGSQTLVRDIVAGIFFLFDDAFRVGDYVSIGSQEGGVEKLSLRTMTLRHYKGQVQVVPYGSIKSVTNWTRGPMMVKFDLLLPQDTNHKKVKKIIKRISAEMDADPEFASHLIDPIKSQGVKSLKDGVMTIRVKFRAKPGTQFRIKREAFMRIYNALTEAGIKFASRGVTVNLPESPSGSDSTTQAPRPEVPAPGPSGEPAPAPLGELEHLDASPGSDEPSLKEKIALAAAAAAVAVETTEDKKSK